MIRIVDYDEADPRPFSFFGIYAVEDGVVAGQVEVYHLPIVTTAGLETRRRGLYAPGFQ